MTEMVGYHVKKGQHFLTRGKWTMLWVVLVAIIGSAVWFVLNDSIVTARYQDNFNKEYRPVSRKLRKSATQAIVYKDRIVSLNKDKSLLLNTKFSGSATAISNTLAQSKAKSLRLAQAKNSLVKPRTTVLTKTKHFVFSHVNDHRLTYGQRHRAKNLLALYKKAKRQINAAQDQTVDLSAISKLLASGQQALDKAKTNEISRAQQPVVKKTTQQTSTPAPASAKPVASKPATANPAPQPVSPAPASNAGPKLAITSSFVVNGWPTQLSLPSVEKAYYNGQLLMFAHTGFGTSYPGNAWHSLAVGDQITIDGTSYKVTEIRHDSAASNNIGGANSAWYFDGRPTMQTCDNAAATLDEVIKLSQQ